MRRRDERRSLKKAGSNNKRRLKADLDPRPSQTLIAGPGFQDLKWKHWPASFCRKSKGFMKAQKGRRLLNNGRLNKTPKTPKTNKTSSGGTRIGRIRSRRFLCVRIQLFIQKEKSERISHLEDTVRIILIWSEWRDSNARPRHPKCRVLPTALHPDIWLS